MILYIALLLLPVIAMMMSSSHKTLTTIQNYNRQCFTHSFFSMQDCIDPATPFTMITASVPSSVALGLLSVELPKIEFFI